MKVYVAGGDISYVNNLTDLEVVSRVSQADLVLFTGGSDVSPFLYGESPNARTFSDFHRDRFEQNVFKTAVEDELPMLGICRGAQFLTVMNGGKLYQDVTDHAVGGGHSITTIDGQTFQATSTHHQMMKPWDVEHKLIAWSTEPRSRHYQGGEGKIHDAPEREPEIVFYPKTRSLAIQPHPEYMPFDAPFVGYVRQLVVALYHNHL
jgi:gamma-glutamyl-gamma-aminobutyrate hydrolase PuuD